MNRLTHSLKDFKKKQGIHLNYICLSCFKEKLGFEREPAGFQPDEPLADGYLEKIQKWLEYSFVVDIQLE